MCLNMSIDAHTGERSLGMKISPLMNRQDGSHGMAKSQVSMPAGEFLKLL